MNKTPNIILQELKEKFDQNFDCWLKQDNVDIKRIFLLARAISVVGQILNERVSSKHHKRCCQIFDEIFSDIISATYLASCAIDKPANIVSRRVIELGVAVIYLWDMPHIFYSWVYNDHDLSFSEMITHINSNGYRLHVEDETGNHLEGELLNSTKFKKYYAELSDIVHGKINSFESNLPNRFIFCEKDWAIFSGKINDILDELLKAYLKRFDISKELINRLPAITKIKEV